MKKCVHLFFYGRVQGVGFRFIAKTIADKNKITGWIGNLPDGRVEAQIEGTLENIDKFLTMVRVKFTGYLDSIEDKELPLDNYLDFKIL
jgi:acylphosphatase